MKNKKREKPKIGLALGMGGARALAHIGVIKVLEEAGIKIDFIAGVSMGAMIGAGYAANLKIEEIESIALETDWKMLFSLVDLGFPTKGLIDGSKIEKFITSHIGDTKFSDTRIPFAIIATDVEKGERIIFNEGSITKAVRASLSIPVFFKPFKYDGKVLVDGGLTDPVPVKLVKKMGADFVIAINTFVDIKEYFSNDGTSAEKLRNLIGSKKLKKIMSRATKLAEAKIAGPNKSGQNHNASNVREIASRMLSIMGEHLALPQLKKANIVVTPEVDDIGTIDFIHAKEIIARGERAALEVLANL